MTAWLIVGAVVTVYVLVFAFAWALCRMAKEPER